MLLCTFLRILRELYAYDLYVCFTRYLFGVIENDADNDDDDEIYNMPFEHLASSMVNLKLQASCTLSLAFKFFSSTDL